ncbi:MAG: 16S rRNA (uracil(1498)-N(3))-methyltransferase [Microbacterium sp.]|uniref:16S rRNA (uracil(1498)-N(3))-methyltransferase n=1 Tax=Microbacterium sp. TaxID=51671 RepID=UPI003A897445
MALHFVIDPADVGDDAITLTGPEAHHAATVRRVRVGEDVTLGDGRGAWLTGRVRSVQAREVVVEVTGRGVVAAPVPRLVLVQALAKGDRDELAVQAATELGVDAIVPWQAARSVSRWEGVKRERGRQRWATIVREAAKQSHRAWIPEVTEPVTTSELARRAAASTLLVLEPTARRALARIDYGEGHDVVLVVGPEGGIAPDERQQLTDAGGIPVRLGGTVLRTSTAGPAALAVASVALGRW